MNKLYIVRLVQLILVVLLALIIFMGEMVGETGLYLDDKLKYIPMILWGGVLLCGIIDLIISAKILQIILLAFFTFVAILMYFDGGITELNSTFWLLGILYSPICLFRFAKTPSKYVEKAYKERTLPMGFYSMRFLLITLGCFFCIITFYLLWSLVFKLNNFIGLALLFIGVFIAIILIFVKLNPLNRATKKINKEANFSDFKASLDLLLAENLHPETRSYVKMFYSNYLGSVNRDESIKMFESITRPSIKSYAVTYDTLEILYYIKKQDYDAAQNMVEKHRIKYPKNSAFCNNVELIIKIENSNNIIDNIEQSFPINTPLKFQNIGNAYTLAYYYNSRKELDKAKHYANIILSYNTDLDEYNKLAKEITNELVENNEN